MLSGGSLYIAWRQVTASTVQKCFRKAGIWDKDQNVISVSESENPFLEADELMELDRLVENAGDGDAVCTMKEFVDGDNDLPICADMDSDDWETEFLNELTNEKVDSENEDDSDCDIEYDIPETPPKLKSCKEAILALEEVSQFPSSQRTWK